MARFRDLQTLNLAGAIGGPFGPDPFAKNAPVAQLDRASDYESEGRTFESFRARHSTISHDIVAAWRATALPSPRCRTRQMLYDDSRRLQRGRVKFDQ
jgi:hypothetical protein